MHRGRVERGAGVHGAAALLTATGPTIVCVSLEDVGEGGAGFSEKGHVSVCNGNFFLLLMDYGFLCSWLKTT